MYLRYYGLTEPPFSITPDPRFVFLSERHRDALAHLLFGIGQGGGGGFGAREADEAQFEAQAFGPERLGGAEEREVVFAALDRADAEDLREGGAGGCE